MDKELDQQGTQQDQDQDSQNSSPKEGLELRESLDTNDPNFLAEGEVENKGNEPEEGHEEGDAAGNTKNEYKPNTKFKVDGKELEFDDKIKTLLTKDNEPVIRELVEKAHGIDVIKARHEEVKHERDFVKHEASKLVNRIQEISGFVKEGDLDSFFESVGIPFEKLADWMARKLQMQEELPEQARGLYDENRAYRSRLRDTEKQIQLARSEAEQAVVQARSIQLDTEIANEAVREIASEYDERIGEPGGFRRAVISHAAAQEHATQRSIDAREAVTSFLRVLGRSPGTPGAAKPAVNAPATNTKRVVTPQKVQTIPNVGASAGNAVGRKPKNIDDLKAMAKEMRG